MSGLKARLVKPTGLEFYDLAIAINTAIWNFVKFAVDQGEIEKEAYYRVTLDADIYSLDEETITSIIEDQEQMMATNEVLFKVYCGVIAEPLFNILTSDEDTVPDGLAGIENNE